MGSYRVYGLNLSSDFPFQTPLPPAAGAPDLVFTCSAVRPEGIPERLPDPVYVSPYRSPAGDSRARLYRLPAGDLLEFTGGPSYLIGERSIEAHLPAPGWYHLVELQLLGSVLAYFLERAGVMVLHACAVVVEGQAIAFVGENGRGKSSLGAEFLHAGFPLLTDDLLAIDVLPGAAIGRPGYPQVRLWPDTIDHFLGSHEPFPRAHPAVDKRRVPVVDSRFGGFWPDAAPLARIYLPERATDGGSPSPELDRLSSGAALLECLRRSYLPHVAAAMGWQEESLARLTQLAALIPFQEVRYSGGLQELARVREAILRDLRT